MQRRDNARPEKKMEELVRDQKDAKEKLRRQRQREDLEKFIKEQIIEGIVEKAHCYGESL